MKSLLIAASLACIHVCFGDCRPLDVAIRGSNSGQKAPVALADGTLLVPRTVGWNTYFNTSDGILHVPNAEKGAAGQLFASTDMGRHWFFWSEIFRDTMAGVDIGDGHLLRLRNGTLMYSARHNHVDDGHCTYRIQVFWSVDNGRRWNFHSNVMKGEICRQGLWSSFLLELRSGQLQCYFDDEISPAEAGLAGHQWASVRTWDGESWRRHTTVSRAHNLTDLSRDGMCTVLERDSFLFAVCESVDTSPPHAGVVRSVTSLDHGLTWSWKNRERKVVYQPANHSFNALSPWLAPLGDDIVCAFASDEHEAFPGKPSEGVHKLNLSVEYILSRDGGRNWGSSHAISPRGRRGYSPGLLALSHSELIGTFLAYQPPVDFYAFSVRKDSDNHTLVLDAISV
jgi:hypothetical protein